MKLSQLNNKRARRLLAIAAIATMSLGVLTPKSAQAAEYVACVKDNASGNVTGNYTDRNQAISNAYGSDKTLVMLQDWNIGDSQVEIADSKELTIDMNGHRIEASKSYESVIYVNEHAKLTLTSSGQKTSFTYTAFDPGSGNEYYKEVKAGGLVTGGGGRRGGGIHLEAYCELTLKNIVIGGNAVDTGNARYGCGGGIYAEKECTIKMTGNSHVQNNKAEAYGGGIYLNGADSTVEMEDSYVWLNRSSWGGGICSDAANTTIKLTKGSAFSYNIATFAGGGVYFNKSKFSLVSADKKGSVANNKALQSGWAEGASRQSGGGIHVDSKSGENEGLIQGINIKDNYSAHDGGGIELDQERTTVRNCVITGNSSGQQGGGIYVNNDDNTIDGCTIQDNWCDGGYEGGGVYVPYRYDIKMIGKCTVTGNTRGKDSSTKDDVFLNTIHGQTGFAYITGGVSKGSSVGVRTPNEGDRRIGDKINNETTDCFFIDLDGYYVSYGTDHGGDMWQRHTTKGFELTVKGRSLGRYQNGTAVTVNGTSSTSAKVFKCWNADRSTGLYPFSDYIGDSDLKNPTVSFKMPQNDVRLEATFVTRVTEVALAADAPTAGKALPTTGTLSWKDGNGNAHEKEVALTWLEKGGDKWVSASGDAKYGTTYAAEVSVDQDLDSELAFALNIDAAKQTVRIGGTDVGAASASVDAAGALRMRTKGCTTEKPTVTSVEGASVTVQEGATEAEFRKLLPATAVARTNAGTAVKLEVDASEGDLSALVEDGKVKKPADGKAVTVRIPLKSSDEVTVPSGKDSVAVEVTVTDAPKTAPDAPTVSPDEGTYSTSEGEDKFDNGSLTVTATCATEGATIRYRLDHCDDGWVDDTEVHDYKDGISLAKKGDDQRLYELEIWSVNEDGLESEHGFYLYVIDDIRDVTVTVKGTDTGIGPKTETLETHPVRKGASLAVSAPGREGYAFEKWVDSNGTELSTSTAYTLAKVDGNTTLTAVYNPVVTEIDIHIGAPEAHEILNQAARTVKATVGGKEVDLTSHLSSDKMGQPTVTWAPAGDDEGRADHTTAYTASLEFKGSSTETGAKYVLSDGVAIKRGGEPVSGASAYIVEADGTKRICIEFPETAGIESAKVDSLEDVEITREEACGYRAEQDAGGSASWDLPKEVSVTSADEGCGCTALLGVTWNKVEGFDESDYGAQTLTVTGTVDYPDHVSPASDSDRTVTATIRVAAAKTVGALQATIPSGTYKGAQDVAFVCETDDVTIRYTTDGSEPTESSAAYDGGWIEVAQSTSFKARAFRDGWKPSETLEVEYTIQHRVSFDTGTSASVKAQWVVGGECAERPADPAAKGFRFDGWALEDGTPYDFGTPVTGDTALYAQWSANGDAVQAHTVTFDTAGGSAVEPQAVADSFRAERPEDPTLEGFDFEGWVTGDGEEYDFDAAVTESLTLYARWSANGEAELAHLVIFDADGGSRVAAQTITDGEKATEPEAPTRKGYEFCGWTLDGKAFDFSTPVKADLELKATWKAKESKKDDTDKGDSDSGDKQDNSTDNQKGTETKTTTTVKTVTSTADAKLAATGDRTPLVVGALVALGLLAAAAGILAKRKKR